MRQVTIAQRILPPALFKNRASIVPKHLPLLAMELNFGPDLRHTELLPMYKQIRNLFISLRSRNGKNSFSSSPNPSSPPLQLVAFCSGVSFQKARGWPHSPVPKIGHLHASDTYDAISASLTALDLTPMCCRTLRQKGSQNEVSYSINFASRYLLYLQSWSCSKTKTTRRHLLHLGRRYDQ